MLGDIDNSSDTVSKLTALNWAQQLYVNATGDLKCLDLDAELVGSSSHQRSQRSSSTPPASTDLGVTSWNYQACTELILEPISSDGCNPLPPLPIYRDITWVVS